MAAPPGWTEPNSAGYYSSEARKPIKPIQGKGGNPNQDFAIDSNPQTGDRITYAIAPKIAGIGGSRTPVFSVNSSGKLTELSGYKTIKDQFGVEGISKLKENSKTATAQLMVATNNTTGAAANSSEYKSSVANTSKTDPNDKSLDTGAAQKSLDELGSGINAIARDSDSYPELRYPKNMKTDQDCIIFNMIKYVPTKANLSNIPTSNSVFSRGEAIKGIGRVTMAIQGPISDMNSVGWNDGNMNAPTALAAAGALTTIEGGANAASEFAGQVSSMVSGQNKAFQTATKAFFAGQAVQNQELFTRTTGAIANPNLELLFQAPVLREFSFTFLLSPRYEEESIEIKKIIRFFKQGMSVKRASTGVFLKTPNTFKLQYKQKNQDAKFLPQIKECALQNFSVNYTPAQNYSTFNNNSMTAYELTMSFKELIPIYDDDYTKLDEDKDTYIGY
jgi:hypothetical protein